MDETIEPDGDGHHICLAGVSGLAADALRDHFRKPLRETTREEVAGFFCSTGCHCIHDQCCTCGAKREKRDG